MLHFCRQEFADRLELVKKQMLARQLDAMLLFAQESMYWLTGYDTFGFCFFQCLVVKNDGQMVLLTRSADLRQAQHTSIIDDIIVWRDAETADPADDLRQLAKQLGLAGKRLGVEYDTHGLTAKNGKALEAQFENFADLEDASELVPGLRLIKSDAELQYVRKAAQLADAELDAAISTTKAGAFEGDILAAMHGANYAGGGDCAGNEIILGSGRDALLCRNKCGRRNLSPDDQLTLEWAGTSVHYHAAMMQTLVVGKPRPRHEELFAAAKQALLAVRSAMVPGNTFGDLYDAHARVLDALGLSAHQLNACGYSLGARFAPSWMDGPMFYSNNSQPILPGMVLFAHIILFDSESETAMTLGRSYITTKAKAEPLSRHPLDLIVL